MNPETINAEVDIDKDGNATLVLNGLRFKAYSKAEASAAYAWINELRTITNERRNVNTHLLQLIRNLATGAGLL